MEYYYSKLSKLFNLIIFCIIFYFVYYLFQNNVSLFGVKLDLDIIYQGNLKDYKNLYLIYYPLLSLSLSFYLSYRIIIGFIIAPLSLSIFSREYFRYIFVKWKIYTFALAFIFLFLLSSLELVDYGYLTINRFGTTFLFSLCILTFFTAPWTVGNIIRYFFSLNSNITFRFPFVSVILLFFCSSWFYDFYYLFVRQGVYPKTWFYNLTRSVPIYITAGLFWNISYDFLNKRIFFKFISQKKLWFNVKEKYFSDEEITILIFFRKFVPYVLPIVIFFLFFTFNSVNFYKVLDFTQVVFKDGKTITNITFNFNKPYEFIPEVNSKPTTNNQNNKPSNFDNLDLGDYHALIIGIDKYKPEIGSLDTPLKDARVIGDILSKKYNFQVKQLFNPTRNQIIIAIEEYRSNLTVNDNLLIYYAGHGVLDTLGNEGYWQPTDASLNSQTNWISNSWIKSQLNAIKAKHVLLIVDSCFSSAIFKGNNAPISPKNTSAFFLNKISNITTRKALTAGGLEPVLDGGGQGHSIFANALIKILNTNEGPFLGTELYTEINKKLTFNAKQQPTYEVIDDTGHVMGGDFVFIPQSN